MMSRFVRYFGLEVNNVDQDYKIFMKACLEACEKCDLLYKFPSKLEEKQLF